MNKIDKKEYNKFVFLYREVSKHFLDGKTKVRLPYLTIQEKEVIYQIAARKYNDLNKIYLFDVFFYKKYRLFHLEKMLRVLEKILEIAQIYDDHTLRGRVFFVNKMLDTYSKSRTYCNDT